MPRYPWLKKTTLHFGDVWIPIATPLLRGTHIKPIRMVFQVDSGAIVSLVRQSTAYALGLRPEDGKPITLSSVGGSQNNAYLHELEFQFDGIPTFRAPVAIASSENVPHLLGLAGFIDRLHVSFDPDTRETIIS